MKSVPSVSRGVARLKSHAQNVENNFLTLPSPPHISPNATPGEIIAATSKGHPDYPREIMDIWHDALAPARELDADIQACDDHGAFLVACLDHMADGSPIPMGKGYDSLVADWAKTVWKSRKAGVLDATEVQDQVSRNRDSLKEAVAELSEKTAYAKKYRRAIKRGLLAGTTKTLNALLTSKSILSSGEKQRLKTFRDRTARREQQVTEIYKRTYFRKGGGYKAPRPINLKSVRALNHG